MEREADASGQLAEREGLTGKLCFPYMMRGVLRWREGRFDESAKGLREAADLAEQVGRSEVAFQSLFWLGAVLRQRGDYADADTELARALDLCERAGLVAQSVEAISSRAVNLAVAGRLDAAREAADEAERLADRLRYPVGKAASLEARGAVAADPQEGSAALMEARAAWQGLAVPPARYRPRWPSSSRGSYRVGRPMRASPRQVEPAGRRTRTRHSELRSRREPRAADTPPASCVWPYGKRSPGGRAGSTPDCSARAPWSPCGTPDPARRRNWTRRPLSPP